jgi:hypothetical protein
VNGINPGGDECGGDACFHEPEAARGERDHPCHSGGAEGDEDDDRCGVGADRQQGQVERSEVSGCPAHGGAHDKRWSSP